MKIKEFCKTLITVIVFFASTTLLFSQESKFQEEILSSTGKCPSLIVSPSNQNVTSSSGTTSFDVTSNVSWTVSSNQSWCTVTSSGSGNGTIQAAYQENTGAGSRIATITVSASGAGDQIVTVTQIGSAPVLIVTPINQYVTSASGTIGFSVASNVSWTSSSDQAWCTVTPSGFGNGTITAAFEVNTGAGSRIATITVSGYGVSDNVVTVTQLGTAPVLIVGPLNQNVPASSGTTGFTITSNVPWTSSCDQTWCTVTPSGQGNGTLTVEYEENTGAGSRIATITISGSGAEKQTVTVTQSGTTPVLIVTPQNRDVTSSPGETTFNVISNIEWTASSDRTWCTVTPSGTGNGTITAAYETQTATTSRTAIITISGPGVNNQMVTVTQAGIPPSLIVIPLNQYVTSSSGTADFNVVSTIDWTAACDQPWCSITSSGSGNGTITAIYEANTTPVERVATITVTGTGSDDQVVTITQDELITISYSGSPWCPSDDIQDVNLSGTSGGVFSAEPEGLDIDPVTGAITPGGSEAGTYTVKYSLEKPSTGRILEAYTEVAIRETETPHLAIKWNDVLICPNLDNSILSYQWFKDSTPLPGATDQYYLTNKIPGTYTVEVVDKNGCKIMSDEMSIGSTKSPLVFPNPIKSSFRIFLGDVPEGKIRIKITDMAGIEVMNLNTEEQDLESGREISVSDLDNGLYMVHIMVDGNYYYGVKIMIIK